MEKNRRKADREGERERNKSHLARIQLTKKRMRSLRSYLEGEVLKEVGNSVVAGILISASHINPHADGGSLAAIVLAGHTKSVLQGGDLGLGNVQKGLGERQRVAARGGLVGQQAAGDRADLEFGNERTKEMNWKVVEKWE